jgi:hypothetical protein
MELAMKEVVYGYGIRQVKELVALARQRTDQLEELLAQSAPLVSAEWDRTEDAQGRPVVTLRLWDFTGSVTTVFEPKELESSAHMRQRLNRVWGDLLQVRSQQQLQELQEAASPEDA